MNEVYVSCGSCKLLSFYVRFDSKTQVAVVLCSACRTELVRATMAVPEESVLRVAPR